MELKTHKDWDVWKEAMRLAKEIYRVTGAFPREELYGLVSQMRRAAVSVASNIAEGAARASGKESVQFLYTASGPLSEIETQFLLAKEPGWVREEGFLGLIERVRMMIFGLIRQVKESRTSPGKSGAAEPREGMPGHESRITDREP